MQNLGNLISNFHFIRTRTDTTSVWSLLCTFSLKHFRGFTLLTKDVAGWMHMKYIVIHANIFKLEAICGIFYGNCFSVSTAQPHETHLATREVSGFRASSTEPGPRCRVNWKYLSRKLAWQILCAVWFPHSRCLICHIRMCGLVQLVGTVQRRGWSWRAKPAASAAPAPVDPQQLASLARRRGTSLWPGN